MIDLMIETHKLLNGGKLVASGWLAVGVGITRDSHVYEESNFWVAMRRLTAATGQEWDTVEDIGTPWAVMRYRGGLAVWEPDDDPYLGPVGIAHFRHWAVGWIDELMIRADNPAGVAEALAIRLDLKTYPLLNEEDASEREWAADHPDTGECLSDDLDCSCRDH